jgi:formylmethanofuran dehydrogenase subunit E
MENINQVFAQALAPFLKEKVICDRCGRELSIEEQDTAINFENGEKWCVGCYEQGADEISEKFNSR